MQKRTVAFDLETIANYEMLKNLPAPEVKLGNLKDEDKIQAKMKDADQKRLESMGLNRFENLICLFAWCDGDRSGHVLLEEANSVSERVLLEKAWEILNGYDHFVTFNGNGFDVPILNLHSLFSHLRPPVAISTKKYTISNHTDLRMLLGGDDKFAPGKLDTYLRLCFKGGGKPDDIDGSLIQHYWDCDLKDDIVKYGEWDAKQTWRLFEHVRNFYPGIA